MEIASLLPILVIAFLFWFLLIRPQSKRQRAMARMQSALGAGDRVMLHTGMFATVFAVDEEQGRLQLELAPGVVVEAARAAVAQVDTPAERPEADEQADQQADTEAGSETNGGAEGPDGDSTR